MSRAKIIELFSREINPISKGKRKNVYTNGIDDNYPERIELLINNSVTGKMAYNKMSSFIVGKGFVDKRLNNKILNKKKDLTGYDILLMVAKSLVKQKAACVHVNYNGLLEPDYIDVLPYKNCRKEKEDDLDNLGKIYYSNKWGSSSFSFNSKSEKSKWFYPFSRDKNVIQSQFIKEKIFFDENKDNNVNDFRGQVYFLNLEPENVYPLAFIDPAYNDADSEYHSSIYRNNSIKNGFTDKQIIVGRSGTKEEDEELEDSIVSMLGPDGSNIALIKSDRSIEDLAKEIHVLNLGSNIKSDRFKYFDEVNESKILHCFENIPKALVLGNDTSLLGDGGKKLAELKLNYSQDLSYIRKNIEQMFSKIFPNENWEIEPLIKEDNISQDV